MTLGQVCQALLSAWHAPLTLTQCEKIREDLDFDLDECSGAIASCVNIYPGTSLNGLEWYKDRFVPLEMQD